MACAVVAAVVYGSLIPFDFSGLQAVSLPRWLAVQQGQSSLGLPYWLSDVLVNLLLYVPLGLTLRLALRPTRWGLKIEVLCAAVLGLVLSCTVEMLQGMMPARVASLNDVLFNSAGALVGALIAVPLWRGVKRISFAIYCRLSSIRLTLERWLARPGIAMAIAGLNALVIGVWYIREVQRSSASSEAPALPFEHAFGLPYDIGALLLGEALLVYAGLGCLLLMLSYTGARRLAMNWVVLGVVVLAFAAELTRALTQDAIPDVTGVLLALAAASIMTVTVYAFTFAVKRMDRRHEAQPYEGPDRRRSPQDPA